MAVTANQINRMRNPGKKQSFPALTAKTFYQGTLAFIDAATGYLTNDDNGGANAFAGIVCAYVDNSGGASGAVTVECYTEGDFELTGSGFTQAIVGQNAYATDNYVVTATFTSASRIGKFIEYVSSTKAFVRIEFGEVESASA